MLVWMLGYIEKYHLVHYMDEKRNIKPNQLKDSVEELRKANCCTGFTFINPLFDFGIRGCTTESVQSGTESVTKSSVSGTDIVAKGAIPLPLSAENVLFIDECELSPEQMAEMYRILSQVDVKTTPTPMDILNRTLSDKKIKDRLNSLYIDTDTER